jgi:hypothetical protein
MLDSLTPPTDNLYKFLAIGGLAFALLVLVFLLRAQAADRQQWLDAHVELMTAGYVEGGPIPTDVDARRAYYRKEAAAADARGIVQLAGGAGGYVFWFSIFAAAGGFWLWYVKVQRFEDAILRMNVEKMKT